MLVTEQELKELEDIVFGDTFPVAECTNPECGNVQTVESDADYPCPECKKGRLTSPLRELGLI